MLFDLNEPYNSVDDIVYGEEIRPLYTEEELVKKIFNGAQINNTRNSKQHDAILDTPIGERQSLYDAYVRDSSYIDLLDGLGKLVEDSRIVSQGSSELMQEHFKEGISRLLKKLGLNPQIVKLYVDGHGYYKHDFNGEVPILDDLLGSDIVTLTQQWEQEELKRKESKKNKKGLLSKLF